jgi:hypothetical protein|tara:strand:+ start:499 stop:741 length:243 start_codon:yes stop_codon:yes gene_type:complete
MVKTVKADLFDSPMKMKLFKIMYPLLSEDERGDAFLSISTMQDDEVLKLIKTFPQGKPTIVKNMGGIVSLNQMTQPLGMM